MNRTGKTKRVRVLQPGKTRKAGSFDRKLKLQIAGGFLVALVVMVGSFILRSQLAHRDNLARTMKAWQAEYHLSDDQVARIRRIEEDFHGTGNAFTQPTHSVEQLLDHEPSISRVMNPEEAERFLADRARIAKSQPRPIRAHAH
jgi:hypothetical protein